MAGALLILGLSFAYTVETWWLAVEARPIRLIAFVVVGLALVVPITRSVGFRSDDGPDRSPVWVESAEVVFQGFLMGFVTLVLLGILEPGDPPGVIARTGLVHAVPLAFGAALANEFLSGEQEEIPEVAFPRSLGVFAMGAVFLSAPIAPTDEVAVLAARVGWLQVGAIQIATLLVTYLILFELEFRGQEARVTRFSLRRRLGQACMLYAVGLVTAAGMLVAVADAGSVPLATAVRRTIVLGFPAGIGASAARVVLA
jgi:putative integral membrane protein (TIGR02587 family)